MKKVDTDKSKKIITFDLDTNDLKEVTGSKTKAYTQIRDFMKEHGFVHQQGSTFISSENMSMAKLYQTSKDLLKENPYLQFCVKDIRADIVVETQSISDLFVTNYNDLMIEDVEAYMMSKYPTVEFTKDDLMQIKEDYEVLLASDDYSDGYISGLDCLNEASKEYVIQNDEINL